MAVSKRIEDSIFAHGLATIAGADEAGRGSCAGPLVAAAVAVNEDSISKIASSLDITRGLDSKKFDESRREEIYQVITESVLAYEIVEISADEIDTNGLQEMNLSAMRRAISQLQIPIDYVLTDGYPIKGLEIPSLAVWKGDAISLAVGSASIIAKVARDRIMIALDAEYPGYGFAKHKGYSSSAHMEAIERLGITPIHRRSYSNIARLINQRSTSTQ